MVAFRSVKTETEGFTLVEFLVYIGIVGTILLVAGTIAFNVFFGKAKLAAIEEVSQNARFALEKIADRVRNAEAIQTPPPGVSSSSISLQMADSEKDPTEFYVQGGILRMREGLGANRWPLTSDEVVVSTLQFSNISYPDTPGTVRIQMTIKAANPENRPEREFEKTFYTTANVR